ncbi:MAG: DUF4233 domain-containing protein [Pseudonocardia sp.]|nr:DUF4233 domain-containing protein [Pseudonocardia sp.]
MTAPDPIKPDPMKGIRGVFAATLVLESIVVLLALLVLPKFGDGATPLGVGLILAVAVAMIVASGLQRRPWGLAVALALQVAVLLCGFLVPALAVMGVVFVLAWTGLLLLRRDVALRMARGELPGQQVPDS